MPSLSESAFWRIHSLLSPVLLKIPPRGGRSRQGEVLITRHRCLWVTPRVHPPTTPSKWKSAFSCLGTLSLPAWAVLLLVLVSWQTTLRAQMPEGSITGEVRDAENLQGLAEVHVSIIGPWSNQLIKTVTDTWGNYRFLAVGPGYYQLEFKKQGFVTYVFKDVLSQSARTSLVNLQMQKSQANQSIVYLDWRSEPDNLWGSAQGTHLDRWGLDNFPSAHNLWALLENQEISSITNHIDEGGFSEGLVTLVGVHGSTWTQNGYQFDGFNVTDPFETGKALVYPDLGSLQEFQIDTGFHFSPARFPGASFNIISRQGGRALHGEAQGYYLGEPFQSSNLDERLRSFGFTSVPQFKRYAEGQFALGRAVPYLSKWSFFSSFDFQHLSKVVPDFDAVPTTTLYSGLLRLDGTLNPRDQLILLLSGQWIKNSHLGARSGISPSATLLGNDRFEMVQGHWTRRQNPQTVWQLGFGFSHASPTDTFQHGLTEPNQTQLFTGEMTGAAPLESDSARSRFSLLAQGESWRHFPGENWNHLLFFGFDLEESKATEDRRVFKDVQLLFFPKDVAAEVVQYNTPSRTKYRSRELSLFFDDHFQISSRVFFRFGLTLDASNGFLPAQTTGAGTFAPEREFAGANSVISWTSLQPRAGVAVPVLRRFGDSTRLSAYFTRYYHLLPELYLTQANPSSVGGQVFSWVDKNQDRLFQMGEEGGLLRVFGGPYSAVDPHLQRPLSDEWGAGLEHIFSHQFLASLRVFRRDDKRLIETVNVGIPSSAFHPVEVFDPGNDNLVGTSDDQILTIYNQDPNTLGRDHFSLTNPPDFRSLYEGIEAVIRKELVKRWFLSLSFTAYKGISPASPGNSEFENDPGAIGSLFDNPNTLLNARGRLFFDRAYVGKLSAYGRAPLGFDLSSVVRYSDGLPFGRRLIISGFNQGPFFVMATPRGEPGGVRTEFNMIFDQRIGHDFRIAGRKFSSFVDIFNLFNLNKSLREEDLSGPFFDQRRPLEFLNPRVARFGIRWNF